MKHKTTNIIPVKKSEVARVSRELDFLDSNSIVQFGAEAQRKISEFSAKVLAQVKVKDIGAIGKTLAGLATSMKELGLSNLSQEKRKRGFLARIF